MNETESRQSTGVNFSLLHLLIFTALIAVGVAVRLAYQKNRALSQYRDELLSLSSRLRITNEDELALASMPEVAAGFHSWQVHVPKGQDYELRLGMGAVSQKGIPPIVGSVRLAAGQHRVTLHAEDSTSEGFRYVVYVDGIQVIEKSMGSDWIPGGWSSRGGIGWPREPKVSPAPIQLTGQSYEPKLEFEFGTQRHYFNGQKDDYVTRTGYRLWIDQLNRTNPLASPFMGFPDDSQFQGVGLRDGIRYVTSFHQPYQWTFTRPTLATIQPVLRIEAEFFASNGTSLSSQSSTFKSWQIRNAAIGTDTLRWQEEPTQTTHTAFLHATSKSDNGLQPVVELRWDADKPDEVGLRLADTPANESIVRWRLRILDGGHHLWRELQIGERPWITPNDAINAGKVLDNDVQDESSTDPSKRTIVLNLGENATSDIRLQWQTNETLPLQIVSRSQKNHAGLKLYQGLPVTLGIQIPGSLKPGLDVDVVDQHPNGDGTTFPGGPVFDEVRMVLEAVEHGWIWLSAKVKE